MDGFAGGTFLHVSGVGQGPGNLHTSRMLCMIPLYMVTRNKAGRLGKAGLWVKGGLHCGYWDA